MCHRFKGRDLEAEPDEGTTDPGSRSEGQRQGQADRVRTPALEVGSWEREEDGSTNQLGEQLFLATGSAGPASVPPITRPLRSPPSRPGSPRTLPWARSTYLLLVLMVRRGASYAATHVL